MLIFDRCHCSWAAVTPVKYECDFKNPTYIDVTNINNRRINTLKPRQNGHLFTDATFKRIFLNENDRISIKISLKFVTGGPIDNIPTLVQIMAWRRPGDKPLSEPMMVRLPTHICITRPQWVKERSFSKPHPRTLLYNNKSQGQSWYSRGLHKGITLCPCLFL